MSVSLESYTIEEDAGQGFDLVVSIKLKQYKSFGTKVLKIEKPKEPEKTTEPPKATVETPRPAETAPEHQESSGTSGSG
jgi:hypothetical protein